VQVERFSVTIAVASGSAVGYVGGLRGRILAIIYNKSTYANGVTLSAALELSGEPVLVIAGGQMDVSRVWYPRTLVHKAADGTTVGSTNVEPVTAADDRLVLTVGSAGTLTTGTFIVVVG
jgi:hypothetical protein